MLYLYVLIIELFILLVITYYSTGKDLLSPPMIMIFGFILSSLFAVINGIEWGIVFSAKSFSLISVGILSFIFPYIIAFQINNKQPMIRTEDHCIIIDKWKVIVIDIIDVLILILYWKSIVNMVGTHGGTGISIQWTYRLITSYEGSDRLGAGIRLVVKLLDASAYIFMFILVNNQFIYKTKKKDEILLIIPPILFCIKTLMGGGRQDLLKMAAFAFITLYIQNHNKIGWDKNLSFKYIRNGLILVALVLIGFYYALRFTGRKTTRNLFVSLSTYIGGSIQHFNQYIKDPVDKSNFFGNESFTPILNTLNDLGIIVYKNTVHLEYRKLGVTSGNVYTFFRRPLQDFGIIGMVIFTTMVSVFFAVIYIKMVRNKPNDLKHNLYTIIYVYLLYWIVLSSIEQYSMTVISIQTLLTIIIMVLLWEFLFCIKITKKKIVIKKWSKISKIE